MRCEQVVARGVELGALNIALVVVLVVSVCFAVGGFLYVPRLYLAGVAVLAFVGFASTAARALLRPAD